MKTLHRLVLAFALLLVASQLDFAENAMSAQANATRESMNDVMLNRPNLSSHDDVFWDSRFTNRGLDGVVQAIATSGNNVYVAGHFMTADNVVVNRVAMWNGNNWSALGQGLGCGVSYCAPYANAIAISGSNVYIGGMFTTAGTVDASSIAVWNGNTWSALGSGVDGVVNAIAVSGNDVYVGGFFTTAGGISAHNIAKWNSLTNIWSALGDGIYGSSVNALAIMGSDVYVGGYFDTAGGIEASNIAKWNGGAWSSVGQGVWNSKGYGARVNAFAISGNDLYVGGIFDLASSLTVNNLAKWNGSVWEDVGGGIPSSYCRGCIEVYALATSGSDLYVGADYLSVGGVTSVIAKWNGSAWSSLGSGTTVTIYAVAISGSNIYAGGAFGDSSWTDMNYLAKWDNGNWLSISNVINNTVNGDIYAIAAKGDDVYIGGNFTRAGNVNTYNIAKWNRRTNTWSPLSFGVPGTVYAIAVNGNEVYVGGCLSWGMNGILKWNGSIWSLLGNGLSGCVRAIATNGTDVYAGGSFTFSGPLTVNGIAKWNGNTWSPLGSGLGFGRAYALALNGNDLYVGGTFFEAGGVSALNIARWNGSTWSAVGTSGLSYPSSWAGVSAIAIVGNDVYVGGQFSAARTPQPRSVVASNIAKWNGTTWSSVGGGVDGAVNAMAMNKTDLYVGGNFMLAGNVDANRIAKWDGIKWTTLGSGVWGERCEYVYCSPYVQAIAVSDSDVYVGGQFSVAGNKPSYRLAHWSKNQLYLPLVLR